MRHNYKLSHNGGAVLHYHKKKGQYYITTKLKGNTSLTHKGGARYITGEGRGSLGIFKKSLEGVKH